MEKRKYKKRTLWSKHAENLLLDLWEEKIHELKAQNCRKSSIVRRDMACALEEKDVWVTASEVKMKLQNLTTKYKGIRAKLKLGDPPPEWEHYERVKQILNSVPRPPQALYEDDLDRDEIKSLSDGMEFKCDPVDPFPSATASEWPVLASPFSPVAVSSSPASSMLQSLQFSKSTSPDKELIFHERMLKKMDKIEAAIEAQTQEIKNLAKEVFNVEKRQHSLIQELVRSSITMNNAFKEYIKKKDL